MANAGNGSADRRRRSRFLRLVANRFGGESHGPQRPPCDCLLRDTTVFTVHTEAPDRSGPAWAAISQVLRSAAEDGREVLAPARELPPEIWNQLTTLPPELGELAATKQLVLYGSALRSIPPEIGRMGALEIFVPYTSYGLHWFPYEITRCSSLRDSVVSTRAIYGNQKTGLPFPELPVDLPGHLVPATCSVCDRPLDNAPIQRWITLRVATDDLPLLVQACSDSCVASLPPPAAGHIDRPHQGGPDPI